MKSAADITLLFAILFLASLRASDAPDGTQFKHSVLAVDSADTVRIRFCGVPLQLKLANVQFKCGTEKEALTFLQETLRPGTPVKIELEPDLNVDSPAPPLAQLFCGDMHINLELIRHGYALSDGRSRKFAAVLRNAQLDAMNRKAGLWSGATKSDTPIAVTETPAVAAPGPSTPVLASAPTARVPEQDLAPPGYNGAVVADLSSREYHYPGCRFARNIRAGARIEYRSPEEAERAGKVPSPFSFPERARAIAEKHGGAGNAQNTIADARRAYAEALAYMQDARKQSRTNNNAANENWRKAATLLGEHLDKLIPFSDADPNNRDLQKLTEDMSMSLYSCKKYQSL